MVYVPTCLRTSLVYVPTYQRTNKRANVPNGGLILQLCVQTCQMARQFFNLVCQRANVPKGVSIFQTFFLRNAKENVYSLSLYEKFYILLDITAINIYVS